MQNIVLTTRLTTFGCLSVLLAGYGVWLQNNIHKKYNLKDILFNIKFKTDPFIDYHDYFPTEEDIADNIINDNFLDEISHVMAHHQMLETADYYDELFDVPEFVKIFPKAPTIQVTFASKDQADQEQDNNRDDHIENILVKHNEHKTRKRIANIIIPKQKPQHILSHAEHTIKDNFENDVHHPDKKDNQKDITTSGKINDIFDGIFSSPSKDVPDIKEAPKTQLSAIERAVRDLSRHADHSEPFYEAHTKQQKKQENTRHNTVKTNYFSLYKPQTDLDQTFVLPISDALHLSNKTQLDKRDNFKKDIADIYDRRRIQTLTARQKHKTIDNYVSEINKILKQMGISLEKKFYAHRHNLQRNSILSDMNISQEDMVFRFPKLYSSLQKAQSLKIALSFIPTSSPVRKGRLSSNYGWRKDPFHRKSRFHSGIDFAAPTGTPVYSPASGTVKFVGWRGGYGKTIEIYHGNGVTTRYAHLSRFNVKKGQKILQFSRIGAIGSTGRSTGPHLHYEIMKDNKKMNPRIFTSKNKKIVNIINNIN